MENVKLIANVENIINFTSTVSKLRVNVKSGGPVYIKDSTVTNGDTTAFEIKEGCTGSYIFWDISEIHMISQNDSIVEYQVESDLRISRYVKIGQTDTVVDMGNVPSFTVQNISSDTIYIASNRTASVLGQGTMPICPNDSIDMTGKGCHFLHLVSSMNNVDVFIRSNQ